MNNQNAQAKLDLCLEELESIRILVEQLGEGARPVPYLKKYSVIRASGSIENCFKSIIADKVDDGSHQQLRHFIKRKIRESSNNPRYEIIVRMLAEFDSNWKSYFVSKVALADRPRLVNALKTLVAARNSFAHGGDPDMSIDATISCFKDGVQVLGFLDDAVHRAYDDAAEPGLDQEDSVDEQEETNSPEEP